MEPIAVEIVQPPLGEAPLWVREAWVGLTLPVIDRRRSAGFGVLTGPRTWLGQWRARLKGKVERIDGYWVESALAIELLGYNRPEAAHWWRGHCPAYDAPGMVFIFDLPACKPVY